MATIIEPTTPSVFAGPSHFRLRLFVEATSASLRRYVRAGVCRGRTRTHRRPNTSSFALNLSPDCGRDPGDHLVRSGIALGDHRLLAGAEELEVAARDARTRRRRGRRCRRARRGRARRSGARTRRRRAGARAASGRSRARIASSDRRRGAAATRARRRRDASARSALGETSPSASVRATALRSSRTLPGHVVVVASGASELGRERRARSPPSARQKWRARTSTSPRRRRSGGSSTRATARR